MIDIDRPRIRARSRRGWTRRQQVRDRMRDRPWLSWLGAGTLVLAGMVAVQRIVGGRRSETTPGDESQLEGGEVTAGGLRLLQPPIDFVQAQEIALLVNSSAAVTSVELEVDGDELIWEVELDNGFEYEIDAMTGAVLKIDRELDDWGDENGDEDENDWNELEIRVDEFGEGGDGEWQDADSGGNGEERDIPG